MKRCKVCLTENYFPQPLEDSNLIEFSKTFFKTFGVLEDLDERHLFCFECKSQLWKSYTLIQKALCAQQALFKLQQKQTFNAECLQNIRNQYGLFSSLGYHKVEVDYFITGVDNTDEEEVDIKILDTQDVIIKQEYSEYFIDTVDMDENYSSTQKERRKKGKKGKRHRKMVEPVMKKAKRPYKKKDIIVDTGPRPVDVTVDHIIEGKRRTKKLLEPELTQNDTESETDDIPLQQRKKKKIKKGEDSEQEYNPYKNSDTDSSSSDYYSTATGKRLKYPVRVYPRECELCSSEVQTGKDHYLHYVNYHKETQYPFKLKKEFVCHQCGKLYSNKLQLTDHMRTHKAEKTIGCEICNKMFFTMKRKLAHIRLVHVPKKFFCDYCGKGFTGKSDLVLHVRTHTGEKPYSCHICGVRYAHGGNVLVHIRNIHQKDGLKKQNKVKKNGRTAKHIAEGKKTKKSGKKATSSQNKKEKK